MALGLYLFVKWGQQHAEVIFEDGHSEMVDGVIITTPAYQAAHLLADLPAANQLKKIDYIWSETSLWLSIAKTSHLNWMLRAF